MILLLNSLNSGKTQLPRHVGTGVHRPVFGHLLETAPVSEYAGSHVKVATVPIG